MIAALVLRVLVAQATPAPAPAATAAATALPDGAAVIHNSGSTNTAAYDIVVVPSGDATIVRSRVETHARLAAPQTRWLFVRLARAAALDSFPSVMCMKSASFGSATTLEWNGHRSPDLSCPGDDPALREFGRIAQVIVTKLGVRTQLSLRRMSL